MNETKVLHQKRKNLSKIEIIEFSILHIILNYLKVTSQKIEELSELEFLSKKNEELKNSILNSLSIGNDKVITQLKSNYEYDKIMNEIKENSNIQIIINNKSEEEIVEILGDLIENFKEQNNLKKIESLEKELINNLDENSYSELIKLKSQLNRE